MPTYEYECTKCGHTFEKLQSFSDKPLSRCPKCKSKIRRLISSGVGIIFKGSGFYATDYRKDKQGPKKENAAVPVCPKQKEGCNACHQKKE